MAPLTDAAAAMDALLAPWGLGAELLGERAAVLGLRRGGRVACGGATRLLATRDGWVAVALPRRSDLELLPAWLGIPEPSTGGAAWDPVADAVAARGTRELVAGARLLGLACAGVGERTGTAGLPAEPADLAAVRGRLVVDVSALWAGPLCAELLAAAGARVVKVEDVARPDGARRRPRFYDLVNGRKASVALDFSSAEGRAALASLLRSADVVVTSARRRAFEQLDLDPATLMAAGARPTVWVAITSHGWASPRVGFGDDAAAAGGVVAWHPDDGAPRFAADALADPLTGAVAAVRATLALAAGTPAFVDCPLAGCAAAVRAAGPARAAGADLVAAPPRARRAPARARPLGADTAAVLDAVGA